MLDGSDVRILCGCFGCWILDGIELRVWVVIWVVDVGWD